MGFLSNSTSSFSSWSSGPPWCHASFSVSSSFANIHYGTGLLREERKRTDCTESITDSRGSRPPGEAAGTNETTTTTTTTPEPICGEKTSLNLRLNTGTEVFHLGNHHRNIRLSQKEDEKYGTERLFFQLTSYWIYLWTNVNMSSIKVGIIE